jgi:plasmid stabilization system protein ParE
VEQVSFHPSASAEYADAFGWYQARSQRAADAFERSIEAAVRYVALHPEAPPRCDERHRFCKTKRYPFGIVYRITPNGIRVVAVAHHRQLPGFWLTRE